MKFQLGQTVEHGSLVKMNEDYEAQQTDAAERENHRKEVEGEIR